MEGDGGRAKACVMASGVWLSHPAILAEALVQLVAPRVAVALDDGHDRSAGVAVEEGADLAVDP